MEEPLREQYVSPECTVTDVPVEGLVLMGSSDGNIEDLYYESF